MGYGNYICDEDPHFEVGNTVITNLKAYGKMAAPVKYELTVGTRENSSYHVAASSKAKSTQSTGIRNVVVSLQERNNKYFILS
jgi:hypothetical protein